MKSLKSVGIVIGLCMIVPLTNSVGGGRPAYTFHPFDVPAKLGSSTSAFGVNNRGVIIGNYVTLGGSVDGFVFENDVESDRSSDGSVSEEGRFTDVAIAGASPDDRGAMEAVNDRGQAVGDFIDPATGVQHAFLRLANGEIRFLQDAAPGALLTEGRGINNRGTIVGIYHDAGNNRHGFILRDGIYTTYNHPGATRTLLLGLNDREQILGTFVDAAGHRHAFILRDGVTTEIAVPGAVRTTPAGINNRGQIVGYYDDADLVTHGFLLERGVFTQFDFPGAFNTVLLGINDRGVIVGSYDDFSRGLVATPDERD